MAKEVAREKAEARNDRYAAQRAARIERERRANTLIGRIKNEVRQCLDMAVEVIDLENNPENPWDDEEWMVM